MSQNSTPIAPITNFDPLYKLLTGKLRLKPWTFGLLIVVLNLIIDGWLAWRYDLWWGAPETTGLLEDYMAIITDFVYTPVICGLYLWSLTGSTRVFQQLIDSNIFKSEGEIRKLIDNSHPKFSKRTVFYVVLGFSVLFSVQQTAAYMGWVNWKAVGGWIDLMPVISYARALFWVLMVYAFAYTAYNVSVTILTLREAFKSTQIQLIPLHPDKCGGLGSINHYSNRIALGIGAIGLLISAAAMYELAHGTLLQAYPVMIGILAYILFAPLFFFLPLGTAHDAMQNAKDEEVLELARKFTDTYDQLKASVGENKINYQEGLQRLEHLEKLYKVADSFPIWPFDIRNLRRFVTVVTTPLLPAIFSLVIEFVKFAFFQ